MSSYVQSTLTPGERILAETKIALRAYWSNFTVAALFVLVFFSPALGSTARFLVFAIIVVCVVPPLIRYWTNEFALTNKRVVAKLGMLALSTIEIQLEKIESLRVDQSVFGRLFGYGTIVIVGSGGSREAIPTIPDPVRFRMNFSGAISGARNIGSAPAQ